MPRHSVNLSPDHTMEYELFLSAGFDPSIPSPFIISISGSEQKHVNGFSRRLASDRWALAVPLRPEGAHYLFEGNGTPGDGVWHLLQLSKCLRQKYAVEGGRFLIVGVSNGGSAALRFATLWPELCCGLVVVTGSIQGLVPKSQMQESLKCLNGLPIDMYVGSNDECGFYTPMVELEKEFAAVGHQPLAELTIFPGAGHVCSAFIDEHLIHGKILLMFAHSRPVGEVLRLDMHTAPNARKILEQLRAFAAALGLSHETGSNGTLMITKSGVRCDPELPAQRQIEEHKCSFWERLMCFGEEVISNFSCDTSSCVYDVGDVVEVWSKTQKAWFLGDVVKQSENTVQVEFHGTGGIKYCKKMLRNARELRRPTLCESLLEGGNNGTPHTWTDVADDQKQLFEARQTIDLGSGRTMEFELFVPSGYDATIPTPFIVSVSGMEQKHVNGFSRRLPSDRWVVAVPIRPASSPYFFEGSGADGDGVWHLRQFCMHLLGKYKVFGNRFLLVGVSNGGSSVLRLATVFPELCCGLVVVTGSIQGLVPETSLSKTLKQLHGLPIDMYVGTNDECGFYAPMMQLETDLHAVGHAPLVELTVFQGAGHCCSPLIDEHLIRGKMLLMMARSWPIGHQLRLDSHTAPNAKEIQQKLRCFSDALGLSSHFDPDGALFVCCGSIQPQKQKEVVSKSPPIPVPVECTDLAKARERRSVTPVRNRSGCTDHVIARERSMTPMPVRIRSECMEHVNVRPARNQTPTPRQRSQTPVRTPPKAPDRSPRRFTPSPVELAMGGLTHFHVQSPQKYVATNA